MTAEKQLHELLVYVQHEMDFYQTMLDDANDRMQKAKDAHDYLRAQMYQSDSMRYEWLVDFGRHVLDFADDLKHEEAINQMRMAALGGLTDAEYEEKVANVEEASDDDGLMDGVDLLRYLRNLQ